MQLLHAGPIFADYHQFYLADAAAKTEARHWTAADLAAGLIAQPGEIGIATARNTHVPVRVELHDTAPPLTLEGVDQAAEASLVTAGMAVLAGCTDSWPDATRLAVPPGPLRLRLLASGLDRLSEDGLEGEDSYLIQLWPAPEAPVAVLKPWNPAGA